MADDESVEELEHCWRVLRAGGGEVPKTMDVGDALERLARVVEMYQSITKSPSQKSHLLEVCFKQRYDAGSGQTGWGLSFKGLPYDLKKDMQAFDDPSNDPAYPSSGRMGDL